MAVLTEMGRCCRRAGTLRLRACFVVGPPVSTSPRWKSTSGEASSARRVSAPDEPEIALGPGRRGAGIGPNGAGIRGDHRRFWPTPRTPTGPTARARRPTRALPALQLRLASVSGGRRTGGRLRGSDRYGADFLPKRAASRSFSLASASGRPIFRGLALWRWWNFRSRSSIRRRSTTAKPPAPKRGLCPATSRARARACSGAGGAAARRAAAHPAGDHQKPPGPRRCAGGTTGRPHRVRCFVEQAPRPRRHTPAPAPAAPAARLPRHRRPLRFPVAPAPDSLYPRRCTNPRCTNPVTPPPGYLPRGRDSGTNRPWQEPPQHNIRPRAVGNHQDSDGGLGLRRTTPGFRLQGGLPRFRWLPRFRRKTAASSGGRLLPDLLPSLAALGDFPFHS